MVGKIIYPGRGAGRLVTSQGHGLCFSVPKVDPAMSMVMSKADPLFEYAALAASLANAAFAIDAAILAAQASNKNDGNDNGEGEGEGGDEILDSRAAARVVGRSLDWFGRHRGLYRSALVSRKGEHPRYSRRKLGRQLELVNRSRNRR